MRGQFRSLILPALWDKFINQAVEEMFERFWITSVNFSILVSVCFSIVVNQGPLREAIAADPASGNLVNCEIQRGPCTQELAGMTVTLDVLPKPVKAMKDLKFRVTVSGGKPVRAAYIDLGMPGMDMGPNRVELRAVKDNVYEGEGVIVRCPSGRTTWKAVVVLPETGKVEFFFDVIY